MVDLADTPAPTKYKMRFKRGYLGVMLVTLCLFGSALLCIIANVEKEDVITTKYDYITDVTGLFDFSDAPQYTDYNPNTNYIGYTNTDASAINSPSGISFVSSNSVNNYGVMVAPGTTVTGPSGTVDNSTSLLQATFDSAPVISLITSDAAVVNGTAVGARLYNFKVATVYDWVSSIWPNISTYQGVTMDLTLPNGAPIKNAIFCYSPHVAPGTGELTLSVIGGRSNVVNSLTINPSDYTATFSGTLVNGSPFTITLSMYESWICYGDVSQRENYFTSSGGQIGAAETYYDTTMSLSYTSTVTSGAEYRYMIPSGGVTLASNGSGYFTTYWANGETNGIVTIVLDGGLNTAANPGGLAINYGEGMIILNKGDVWTIDIGGNVTNAGAYRQVALTIDLISGTISLRPVSFTNFVDYTIINTVLAERTITPSEGVDRLTISSVASTTPLRWSVGSTTVLMDTFGAVMVDPTLNIEEYWPNMEYFRLWFQSFALYGDSVTINGETYPIDENGDIEINGQKYAFNNFYVSYPIDGDVYLTFVLGDKTVNLGEKVTDIIEFGGVWYFSAGLYEGTETTKTVYNWAVGWDASPDMFILLSLGLIAGGLVVVKKVRGLSMGALDWLAVVLSVIALLGCLGGF